MSFVDRNAVDPKRLLRNSQRFRNGDATGSIKVTAPIALNGGSISLSLLSTGGLNLNSGQLQVKLADSTLATGAAGLKVGSVLAANLPADVAYVDADQTWTGLDVFSRPVTGSSGTQYGMKITPTISTSGTAGYVGLLVNVIESTLGSGSKTIIDVQKNGSSLYRVDNSGSMTVTGSLGIAGTLVMTGASEFQSAVVCDTTLEVGDNALFDNNVGVGMSAFGGGVAVVAIANSVVPTSNPVGGGFLFVQGGALKYRGSSGTVTIIAPA